MNANRFQCLIWSLRVLLAGTALWNNRAGSNTNIEKTPLPNKTVGQLSGSQLAWFSTQKLFCILRKDSDYQATVINIPELSQEPFFAANNAIIKILGNETSDVRLDWYLPKDRKRLLVYAWTQTSVTCYFIELESGELHRSGDRRFVPSWVGWFPDGEKWIEIFVNPGKTNLARMYSCVEPDRVAGEESIPRGIPIGFFGDDSFLLMNRELTSESQIEITQIKLTPRAVAPTRRIKVSLPNRFEMVGVHTSPEAHDLVWVLSTKRLVPNIELNERFPFISFSRPNQFFLYVSGIESTLKRLASFEGSDSSFFWSTNAARLSYLKGNEVRSLQLTRGSR